MTEDTRKAANVDASKFGRLASATTNLNVAQMWRRQSSETAWDNGRSGADLDAGRDKGSRPATKPEKGS